MEILLALRYLFDTITNGATPVRGLFFLTYVLLLAWRTRSYFPPILSRLGVHAEQRIITAAGVSIVVCFILVTLFQVTLHVQHDIPLSASPVFFSAEGLSVSNIGHTHIGKAVLSTPFIAAIPSLVTITDTGAPLANLLPLGAFSVLFVAFVAAFIFSLLAFSILYRAYPRGWSRALFSFLYALVAFIVLTKAADGGVGSMTAIAALTIYLLLLWRGVPFKGLGVWIAVGGFVANGLVVIALASFLGRSDASLQLFFAFMLMCVLAIIVFGVQCALLFTKHAPAILLIALCGVSGIAFYLSGAERSYRETEILNAASWVATTRTPPEDFSQIGKVGHLGVYSIPERFSSLQVHDLLSILSVPAAYLPISIKESTCDPDIQKRQRSFWLLVPELLHTSSLAREPYVSADFIFYGETKAGWYRYWADLRFHPCLASTLSASRETLREAGATEYGIIY